MKKLRDPRDLSLVMLRMKFPEGRPRLGVLRQRGYVYVRDVAGVLVRDLKRIPQVDDKTIDWLRRVLASFDLGLA